MEESYTMLDVETISFDTENPRIKMALEKYGDSLTAERIYFALRSATGGTNSTSSFNDLKGSIRASGGVMIPITVVCSDGKYVCTDGNTRLAIYKQLGKEEENEEGRWAKIKSIVRSNVDQRDIEMIRVSAHLIGAREWPAYEKARYLHYLRNSEFMNYSEMVELCGGNKTDIERQIEAYHDMNEYYRDVVDDGAFHIDRFSGFVELQNPGVKEEIFKSGLNLKDFGEWIRDSKIYRLNTVRKLPKVLRDEKARKVFLDGGPRSLEDAIKVLERQMEQKSGQKDADVTLESASLQRLAEVLDRRINNIPYSEVRALRDKENEEMVEQISALADLSASLNRLLEDVSE